MGSRSYKVTSPIRFGGRICPIGETVTMTGAEAAQFAGCIEEASSSDQPDQSGQSDQLLLVENQGLKQHLAELQDELRKHQETMATLADEHDAALQERDKTIADLTGQRDHLFQENDKNVGLLQERDATIAENSARIAVLEKSAKKK